MLQEQTMWQELITLLNDQTFGPTIASFIGNTLSSTVSNVSKNIIGKIKSLFQKKNETKERELTVDDCRQIISEEELGEILEELKQLKNKVLISQVNEEGRNDNEIHGLANATKNVEISQTNKKGDNSLNISF